MKFLLTLLCSTTLLIQTTQAQETDSLLNDLLFDEDILLSMLEKSSKYQFLYATFNFRDQTYFAGRDVGIDQFNLTSQLSYIHHTGFSAGITGIYYSEFEPRLNTVIASVGYGKNFGKFRLRAAFDKYFFADIDSLEESSFNSAMTLGASYRLKYLRTSFNWSFLLGSDPSTQASWDIKGYINLWKKDYNKKIRLEPAVVMLLGNEYFLTSTTQPVGRGIFERVIETETIVERFGLLNAQLRLPLVLTMGNFDFEVGYNYNLPRSLADVVTGLGNTSHFNISVGYLFDLGKK